MSGAAQPIIDEAAFALRRWCAIVSENLGRPAYRLFHIVRKYIEVLHLCHLQLLSQMLSSEETINLQHECVARLVSGKDNGIIDP